MFSPQDRGVESTSRAKQDEIDRIFKRLSHIQTQTSVGLSSEQYDSSYTCWYWSDTALMEKCRFGTYSHAMKFNQSLHSNLSSLP
jgi:hypothetical protein